MKRKPQIRKYPNILITGTPGVGKTTLCEMIVDGFDEHKLRHQEVSEICRDKDFIEERDEKRDTYVIDEDKLCDYLEEQGLDGYGDDGGHIVDYHSSCFFAERYFDLVIVLRSKIEEVAKRLKKRQYSDEKIRENVQCEIMQVCQDEATESYKKEIIRILQNNTFENLEENVKNICEYIRNFAKKNKKK